MLQPVFHFSSCDLSPTRAIGSERPQPATALGGAAASEMLPAAADHLLQSAAVSRTKSWYRLGAWPISEVSVATSAVVNETTAASAISRTSIAAIPALPIGFGYRSAPVSTGLSCLSNNNGTSGKVDSVVSVSR
jgi:hypothetical protein